jgi:exodeoxyribonuclease-3
MRLVTYNIQRGGVGRVDRLAAVINACAPDVVLLQEATRPDVVEALAVRTRMSEARAQRGHSLAFLSRERVAHASWHRPRFSRHSFLEVVPAGGSVRLFGVHLSATHAAWTERRRVFEIRALLKAIAHHQYGFHVLAGDFNTLTPGERLDVPQLPFRLRPLVWLSGGRINWRTLEVVAEAGYVDAFRLHHPKERGTTMPAWAPHVRLDYVFVPALFRDRVCACDIVQHPQAPNASDHLPLVADVSTAPG